MTLRTDFAAMPAVPEPWSMPFHYASLTSLWVWYPAQEEALAQKLEGAGVRAARLEGRCYAVLNFMAYTAHLRDFLHRVTEVEFNALVVPESLAARAPALPLGAYLAGEDQSMTLGHFRLHVPCDSEGAVQAGRDLFGEPKFTTKLAWSEPCGNAPEADAWEVRCQDPTAPETELFSLRAALRACPSRPFAPVTLVEYNLLRGRLAGCRKNFLGPLHTSFEVASACELALGASAHPMRADLERLLGPSPRAVAAQVFQSTPVAVEGRAFYPGA